MDEFWQTVLNDLSQQMTQATFDTWLRPTRLVKRANGRLVVAARNAQAKDWLENRLQETIQRVVDGLAGESTELVFIVESEPPEPPQPPAEVAPPPDAPPVVVPEAVRNFDYFTAGGGGWVKFAHYIPKFWRSYLGDEAIDIWEWVRAQSVDAAIPWTAPVDVRGIDLARAIRAGVQKITGVYRPCPEFDRRFFEDGEVLAECCGRHTPTPGEWPQRTRASDRWPEGRPICRYWQPGALEIMLQEGIAVWEKRGSGPRNTYYTIQVYQAQQRLPLLTARQVERLPVKLQMQHARFLRKRGLYEPWREATAELYSLLALDVAATGLELPLPEAGVGVLGGREVGSGIGWYTITCNARKNDNLHGDKVILSTMHPKNLRNYIFFPISICASESGCT